MLKKLPQLSKIKSYPNFYRLLFKLKSLDGVKIDVTKVVLTDENELTLTQRIKEQERKAHKKMPDRVFNWSWGMEYLSYSPSCKSCKHTKNGYAWIEKGAITKLSQTS